VYSSEQGWSGSGGGPAADEGYPSYQYNQPWIAKTYGYPYNVQVYNNTTGTYSYYSSRMTPDVSYNADLNTGYAIYDSIPDSNYGFGGGWTEVGGTSAGAPQWSALVALADQARGSKKGSLDTNQVLNTLYNTLGSSPTNRTYTSMFHDIQIGSNGYDAGLGYDLVTGLGSPIANALVPFLAKTTIPQGQLPTIVGTGYGGATGSSSGSLGSTTFTSFGYYGSGGAGQPGGGLYSGSGSISLPPSSSGTNGQTNGAPIASTANAPASAGVMLFSTPLLSTLSTTDGAGTNLSTNMVGNFSALAASSPNPTIGGTTLTAATTTLGSQANGVFGATGWNGSAQSWRQGNLDLPGSPSDKPADDAPGILDDLGSDQSSDFITGDDGDVFGEDAFHRDAPDPAATQGDAGSDG
jgi:hypothetical protein